MTSPTHEDERRCRNQLCGEDPQARKTCSEAGCAAQARAGEAGGPRPLPDLAAGGFGTAARPSPESCRRVGRWLVVLVARLDRGRLLLPAWRRSQRGQRSGCRLRATLTSFASSHDGPVYWVGPMAARKLELTSTSAGTFVRYLPLSASIGDSARAITVGTYPMRNAYATAVGRAKTTQMTSREAAGGGLAVWSKRVRRASIWRFREFRSSSRSTRRTPTRLARSPFPGASAPFPSLRCTDSVKPGSAPGLRLASFGVMLRTLLHRGLLALVFAAPRRPRRRADARRHLRARRSSSRRTALSRCTSSIGPRPTGLYALRPVLSNESILGLEKVTAMQKRLSATATMVGINGDFYAPDTGRPSGVLMRDGVVDSPPSGDRSSVGLSPEGSLDIRRVEFFGTWRGLGQRRTLTDMNQAPKQNGISLFTPSYGADHARSGRRLGDRPSAVRAGNAEHRPDGNGRPVLGRRRHADPPGRRRARRPRHGCAAPPGGGPDRVVRHDPHDPAAGLDGDPQRRRRRTRDRAERGPGLPRQRGLLVLPARAAASPDRRSASSPTGGS